MPRARNIKPGFFANEELAECSPWARLCFAGLWTLADREGRLEDRPKRIKGELFRFDATDVEPLLVELAARGFLERYRNSDGAFIQISKFKDHQTPHYSERKSVIKPPGLQESPPHQEPETPRALQEDSEKVVPLKGGSQPPDILIPDSLNPDSRKEHAASPLRADPPLSFDGRNSEKLNGKSVVELSPQWELPERWGVDAEALGWNSREVLLEAERFRQYWTQGKGAGQRRAVKGWRQSWSNWLGKAAERKR